MVAATACKKVPSNQESIARWCPAEVENTSGGEDVAEWTSLATKYGTVPKKDCEGEPVQKAISGRVH